MASIDYTKYTEKYNKYDSSVVGKAVITLKPLSNIGLGYPGLGKGISYDKSDVRVGFLTGHWTTSNNVNFVQVEFEGYSGSDSTGYFQYGYVDASTCRIYDFSQENGDLAKSLLDSLVANNREIYENNLLCAALMQKASLRGLSIPKEYRTTLYALQSRLMQRDNKIKNSSFVKVGDTGVPPGFSTYNQELYNFMNNPGISGISQIGIAPVVVYIVLTVVITALASYIVYLLFKPDYTDSKADLKVSKKLTAALATLSPEDRQEVLNDLEGQIDKAYVEGKLAGSGLSTLKTIGYAAAGVLGFWFLTSVYNNLKE